nr:reverse transcriptase domain-containing protein [Tanacetum cinerariifolium]
MRTQSRSRSRNNSPQREASPAIVEPLRIELPFLEDQFQENTPPESPMADNRTMAELLQAPIEGYEDAIVILEITANNFELKHDLINLVQNKQFFGHDKEDPHAHIRAKAVVAKVGMSSSTPVISSDIAELKDMVKALLLDKKNQSPAPNPSTTPAQVKAVESNCVTCGGGHSYQNCPVTQENAYRDNIQEYVSQAAAANYNQGNTGFRPQMVANQIRPPGFPPHQNNQNNFNRGNNFNQNQGGNFNQSSFNQGQLNRPQVNQAPIYQAPIPQTQRVSQTDFESYVKANDAILWNIANTASYSGSRTLPGNTITNPKEDLKGITTRSGVAYQGPKTPSPSKQGTKVTKDQVQTPSSQNTAPVQPSVIQFESQASIYEPVVAPVSAPMPNLKTSIMYPSRRDNEKRRDQADEQIEKFYEIFKDMSFEISFTDALILMPKFASTLKALIGNKEKLCEMARTMMNEHCSVVILNKLPRKLGDPEKFLIPCEFSGMDECLALADLGASINLMPLSTSRALIDVHKGELTLRIGNEAITYNLDQTVRYSANYNQMTANKIDVVESACEEYSQEVLGFSNVTDSVTPTPQNDPIISATSPTLTPFRDSDFLLFEEADAFLGLEDDPNLPKINPFYYDPEGDILLLEAILNSEPLPPPPNQE